MLVTRHIVLILLCGGNMSKKWIVINKEDGLIEQVFQFSDNNVKPFIPEVQKENYCVLEVIDNDNLDVEVGDEYDFKTNQIFQLADTLKQANIDRKFEKEQKEYKKLPTEHYSPDHPSYVAYASGENGVEFHELLPEKNDADDEDDVDDGKDRRLQEDSDDQNYGFIAQKFGAKGSEIKIKNIPGLEEDYQEPKENLIEGKEKVNWGDITNPNVSWSEYMSGTKKKTASNKKKNNTKKKVKV